MRHALATLNSDVTFARTARSAGRHLKLFGPARAHCNKSLSIAFRARLSIATMAHAHATQPIEYNFAVASALDDRAFGCCRPGPTPCVDIENAALPIPSRDVDAWVNFMKGNGITHVLSLLAPDELASYAEPVEAAMQAAGLIYSNVWTKKPGSCAAVLNALDAAYAVPGSKVVTHCWGGGGRAGRILAAWLVHRYGLSCADAADAITATAAASGAARRADAESLAKFMAM